MNSGPFTANSFLLMQEALAYWRAFQIEYVDLPWMVERQYIEATLPADRTLGVETPVGILVASGEQSFLKLACEKKLPRARGYMGWTPCFRPEPEITELKQFGFLKAELFVPVRDVKFGVSRLSRLLNRQTQLFESLALSMNSYDAVISKEVISEDQTDILINGIEVGSYGVRCALGVSYLYGTILALPRFTQALRARRTTAA
jgi:hypothetical protein